MTVSAPFPSADTVKFTKTREKRPAEVGGANQTVNRNGRIMNCTPCLSLWERWTSEARTERGN